MINGANSRLVSRMTGKTIHEEAKLNNKLKLTFVVSEQEHLMWLSGSQHGDCNGLGTSSGCTRTGWCTRLPIIFTTIAKRTIYL